MKITNTKPYETDASQIKGKATQVIIPETIFNVQQAVRLNNKITIRGGGTGLAGGAVPQNEVVLDLSKLVRIGELDKERKTIEIEAGVILDDLQNYLERFNLEFPVNPSSHSVCTVGGMIATNAVGSRGVKYGNTKNWVKWIEIIDDKGNINKKGTTEITDYSGMEGITGIIVKANLKLIDKPKRTALLVSKDSFDEVIKLVRKLKRESDVSMIEIFGKAVSKMLGLSEKYHLLIEFESERGKLKGKEYEEILELRNNIYPLLAKEGFTKIEDPKLLLDRTFKLVEFLEEYKIPFFGHLGVGILHPCFEEKNEKLIPEMMRLVKKLGGQITGEHGIGLIKKQYVEMNDKKILVNIKKRTDLSNKFNVGKVL